MASGSHDPTSHLNESHKQQLLNYLKFFRSRISDTAKEIEAAFDDTKDMRLLEEMYSVDDVRSMLDGVRDIVSSNVREEMEKWSSQSALFLRQLMLQAEGNAVQLSLDTHTLEDVELLAGLKKLELESAKSKQQDIPDPSTRKLAAISGATDVKLVTKIKELEDSNRSLLAKFDKLQTQCRTATQDNDVLKEKNRALEEEVRTVNNDMNNLKKGNRDAQQAEIDSLRQQLDELKRENSAKIEELNKAVKAANDAAAEKVNASPQFQQLKKMLVQKNQQIKEQRDKIRQLGGGD